MLIQHAKRQFIKFIKFGEIKGITKETENIHRV